MPCLKFISNRSLHCRRLSYQQLLGPDPPSLPPLPIAPACEQTLARKQIYQPRTPPLSRLSFLFQRFRIVMASHRPTFQLVLLVTTMVSMMMMLAGLVSSSSLPSLSHVSSTSSSSLSTWHHHHQPLRRLQVTGKPDDRSSNEKKTLIRARKEELDEHTGDDEQPKEPSKIEPAPSSDSKSSLKNDEGSSSSASSPMTHSTGESESTVSAAKSPSSSLSTSTSSSWGLRLVLLGVGAVMLASGLVGVMYYYRQRELTRWQQYRTHQLLQAQDEAFEIGMGDDDDDDDNDGNDMNDDMELSVRID